MTLHAVSPALREHVIRIWIESTDLTDRDSEALAEHLDAHGHLVSDRLTLELTVEATSPGKALIVAVQAVDAAVNAVCPRLAGSALGCNWRRP